MSRGKLDLLEHIHSDSPFAPVTVPKPRRTATWIGFTTLGAGALTVALVATNVLGLAGWRGGADAAAASVLESAATATLNVTDPVLAPGQYLLVKTDAVYSSSTASDSGTETAFLESYVHELYVPANRDDDWVWMRHAGQIYQTFGPESEAFAAQLQAYESDELLRAPGGTFYGGSPTQISGDYDTLPRDPHQLLNAIYLQTLGAGPSRDAEALTWIADTLRTGTVPANLRSALYKAAAAIPGVTITEQQATLDGTTGIAIGRVETTNNTRQDIIIDPNDGQFIGERKVTLTSYAGMPAGTATTSTAVTTTITDTAPAGGTQY
ncbi:CU044_5270 family protein [Subtercola boreus]|uniref:CU044_5270 family protein n=1 Tax=Subtercola boreus TaxID=120213 RepID=UPI000E2F7D03|nr:CU044_5270 family protein [Subtercola boreus]